jgi:hypothetical protein
VNDELTPEDYFLSAALYRNRKLSNFKKLPYEAPDNVQEQWTLAEEMETYSIRDFGTITPGIIDYPVQFGRFYEVIDCDGPLNKIRRFRKKHLVFVPYWNINRRK